MRLPENYFLKVPYEEKEQAKLLGARWHKEKKNWYVPLGEDILKFKRWFSFLTISIENKEEVKNKGAKWDNNLKKWYVPKKLNYEDFEKYWDIDKNLINASKEIEAKIENIELFEERYKIDKESLN